MAEFGFAYTLGNAIAQPVQNAVVTGFQIGVGLMMQPFQYFANSFGERVQDELSDLKAAGGLLSISKRSQNPFLRDIDEAIQYQQDTNQVFAKMAASLPGVTNDYVQVGKRLSDTAARIVSTDFEAARQEANRIRATAEGAKFYGAAPIMGTGAEAQKDIITTLLGDLTKKTTIAGLGGPTRAGGIAGAYGLPGLAERMISQEQVSVGQFQKYAAVFSDPTIADALSRNVENINATQKNSVARFKALQKLLDEVVTPELIEKLRTSVDGIYQGFRSTILDPDTGLFGLGRQFQKFGKKLNQYGQYVNEANEVVTDINRAADEDLSLFEIIRDIFSNLGQALLPIAEALPLIFDPLKKVAGTLMDARHYAAEFNRTFNQYREGLKLLSEQKGMEFLKDSIDIRASLSALNNLMAEFGVITESQFQDVAAQLTSKDLNIGKVLSGMLDRVLNSNIAESIGETIGTIVGTVLAEVAKVTGFISGRIEKSNKLISGFQKGFKEAGGEEAFTNIFKDVFTGLFNVLKALFNMLPWQAKVLGAMALVAPAIIQGGAMLIAESFGKLLVQMFRSGATMLQSGGLNKKISEILQRIFQRQTRVIPVNVRDLGTTPKALPPAKAPAGALPTSALSPRIVKGMNAVANFFSKFGSWVVGIGPRFLNFFKGWGGLLAGITGGLITLSSLFKGENLARSLAEGIGPTLGAALGAALIPFFGPIGPLIGSMIGGWIGSLRPVVDTLTGIFEGIGWGLSNAWNTIGPAVQAIGGILQTLWNAFWGLIPGMDALAANFDFLNFAFITVKLAFFPFISALNGLVMGLQTLQLGLLQLDKWINSTFQFGDRQGRLQAQIDKTIAEMEKTAARQAALNASVLQPLPAPKNKPPINPNTSTPSPVFTPVTPVPPVPQTGPAVEAAKTTATNVQGINAKATTHLAHAGATRVSAAATQKATDETKKNTAKTNTTLENIKSGIIAISNRVSGLQTAILGDLNNIQAGVARISSLLASGQLKVQASGLTPGGGPLGTAKGDLGRAQNMASQHGLTMTSWFRPGDKGMHGAGRAMDFSNGVSTPQQMEFAQAMAAQYGTSLKELIYTPLGFGIKDGTRVPLSYWGARTNAMHYNHVHVAFANGLEDGKMFSNKSAAGGWESSMVPGSVKVASITGNSAESFGGSNFGDINVTVNAGTVNDPDELASIVAMKIGEAVADARASSLFV